MKYLIIAGANKSGTTSLFKYLSQHPGANPSTVKQTDYFLQEGELDLSEYSSLFTSNKMEGINIEASPDYMTSPMTRMRIFNILKRQETYIVFLLRDPIDRIKSWYKYGKQVFMIDQDLSINEYVTQLLSGMDHNEAYKALITGRYIDYIHPYIQTFGVENVRVVNTEELKVDPAGVVNDIFNFIGRPLHSLIDFDFGIHNPSVVSRSKLLHKMYNGLRRRILPMVSKRGAFNSLIMQTGRYVGRCYRKINQNKIVVHNKMTDDVRKKLEEYYMEPNKQLSELCGFSIIKWENV